MIREHAKMSQENKRIYPYSIAETHFQYSTLTPHSEVFTKRYDSTLLKTTFLCLGLLI
jgi:hypothetical protein